MENPKVRGLKNRASVVNDELSIGDWACADLFYVTFTPVENWRGNRQLGWILSQNIRLPDTAQAAKVWLLRIKLDKEKRFITTKDGRPIAEIVGRQVIKNIAPHCKLGMKQIYIMDSKEVIRFPPKVSPFQHLPKLRLPICNRHAIVVA